MRDMFSTDVGRSWHREYWCMTISPPVFCIVQMRDMFTTDIGRSWHREYWCMTISPPVFCIVQMRDMFTTDIERPWHREYWCMTISLPVFSLPTGCTEAWSSSRLGAASRPRTWTPGRGEDVGETPGPTTLHWRAAGLGCSQGHPQQPGAGRLSVCAFLPGCAQRHYQGDNDGVDYLKKVNY